MVGWSSALDRVIQLRQQMVGRKENLLMVRLEVFGGFAGNLGFAESLLGKHDGKRVQIALRTAGQARPGGGIQSARKEHAQRNIRNQVVANSFLEQRAQLLCRFLKRFRLRPFR